MRFIEIIKKKRDGGELSRDEIAWTIEQYAAGSLPDYQISAWLMAILLRGMTASEMAALTSAMLGSGRVLDLSRIAGAKVDKHSTGGVGDKTSLVIAPLAAAAGLRVPMISGRGLGHTGGTLDKLEAIPGFSVDISVERFEQQVERVGAAIIAQSAELVPADKKLYALRDVTATVESQPLICASIMSKKLAEGIDGLVLDVKTGSGAFMKREEDARSLAEMMVATGERMGKKVAALVTDMDQPLGRAVGNALEVAEAIEGLRGKGPGDLVELCVTLTAWMLLVGGAEMSLPRAEERVRGLMADGSGLRKFREMVAAQGGDARACDDLLRLPKAKHRREVKARAAGRVTRIDCEKIGVAALVIGAGRETKDDAIDRAVGLIVQKKLGEAVAKDEALCEIHYNDDARLGEAVALIESAYEIGEEAPAARKAVRGVICSSNFRIQES